MARKSIIKPFKLAAAQSLAASFNSNILPVSYMDCIGFIFDCSAVTVNTGTFGLQARMRFDENSYSAWCDLSLTSVPTLAGAAAVLGVNLSTFPYTEIRAVFTPLGGTKEIQTLTFPAKASAANGDYVEVFDAAGLTWAVALDTLGTAAATPTGAVWVAIPAGRKVYADISGTTDAASVAAAAKAALNALTGFTAALTLNDIAADGTMTSTATAFGPVTNPVPHTKNDGAAGSIAGIQSTGGVACDGLVDVWVQAKQEG